MYTTELAYTNQIETLKLACIAYKVWVFQLLYTQQSLPPKHVGTVKWTS